MARILFIQNFWFEFLGTMILSAVLKRENHSVDLIIDHNDENVLRAVREFRPDIVGAYMVSGSHNWMTRLLPRIKKEWPAFTVIGGPHPTFFPDIVTTPGLDAVCIGEGEEAMLELATRIDAGQPIDHIANLWINRGTEIIRNPLRPLITDLDALPDPDRDLYYKYPILRESPSKHFITGRGCPFTCSFCCNKAYKELYRGLGPMVRRPAPSKVCHEIQSVRRKYPLKSVRFDDEVFLLKPDWLVEFLDRYRREVNLPFSCLIRADLLTEPLAAAMKRAGCYIAYFGIESGNDRIRNQVLGKNISREQIFETARLLRKYHIKIGTFNMVGMPGETFENAWETVTLNQEIRADYPWCSIIQPFPGTDLEKEARRLGCLPPDYDVEQLQKSYFNDTVIANPEAASLVALQKLFYIPIRFPVLSSWVRWMARHHAGSPVLRWIFQLTYAYRYSRTYRMPVWELVRRAVLWKDNY